MSISTTYIALSETRDFTCTCRRGIGRETSRGLRTGGEPLDRELGGSKEATAMDSSEDKKTRDKKARKAEKKEAKKDKKESKKESKKERKEKKKRRDSDLGDGIGPDDFYMYNEHFRCWLTLSEKGSFDELSGDKSRELFKEFCYLYNKKLLSDIFYKNGDRMPMDMVEVLGIKKTAAHAWNFKVSAQDKESLQTMTESIHNDTVSGDTDMWRRRKRGRGDNDEPEPRTRPGSGWSSSAPRNRQDEQQRALQEDQAKDVRRYERKRAINTAKERLEELVPRADPGSKEALIEKRRGASQGHAEAEERRCGGDAMSEAFLMGGDDSLEATKARLERQRQIKEQSREKSEKQRQQRVKELSDKFNEGKQGEGSWLDKLGVDLSAGPIRIAPRDP